ncbi:MAG: histidine phosphatase family protein [Acidobacteriota bacterium]
MDLILWRHAEAEDSFPDPSRRLTPRGRKQALKVAGWLRERLPPDFVLLSSPAVRARDTALALSERVREEPGVGLGATPRGLLRAAGWPKAEGTVVVAGHQPTLGEAAALLLVGEEASLRVKKGSAWWFRSRRKGTLLEITLFAVADPDLL